MQVLPHMSVECAIFGQGCDAKRPKRLLRRHLRVSEGLRDKFRTHWITHKCWIYGLTRGCYPDSLSTRSIFYFCYHCFLLPLVKRCNLWTRTVDDVDGFLMFWFCFVPPGHWKVGTGRKEGLSDPSLHRGCNQQKHPSVVTRVSDRCPGNGHGGHPVAVQLLYRPRQVKFLLILVHCILGSLKHCQS